jgi:hypothetical protein
MQLSFPILSINASGQMFQSPPLRGETIPVYQKVTFDVRALSLPLWCHETPWWHEKP